MIFHVYVIESEEGKRYTGHTGDLQQRLIDHNEGTTFTTKKSRNWKLIYTEPHHTRASAMQREKFLKSGAGRDYIKRMIDGVESAAADSSSGS